MMRSHTAARMSGSSALPPLTYVLSLQIQRGAVHLSYDGGVPGPAVATCVNLTRIFNPGSFLGDEK
jgi:hypothetical protein